MNIGGVYTDPFHSPTTASANIFGFQDPWYGGLRILGRNNEHGKGFVCIGCDDGYYWWTLKGEFKDDSGAIIEMDFTAKAPGVGLLQCSYIPGTLSFLGDDGEKVENTWSRLIATENFELTKQTKHDSFNNLNGLYVDTNLYKPGSFAGIRVVSDRLGKKMRDEICIVGTDDGEEWWVLEGGTFTNKEEGKFSVGTLSGTSHNGTLSFEPNDEGQQTTWTKMIAKMDIHTLPKEIM